MTGEDLQWGGRFNGPPDAGLLAFGSSLEEDLVLAPFDVACSRAHVLALRGGGVVGDADAAALLASLERVADEICDGSFAAFARRSAAEDVHGAIDARVRALAGEAGLRLHSGRSRNDQVATTLALYVRDRARRGARVAAAIGEQWVARGREELACGTLMAGTTHWQPAQPVLLAFWMAAAAEPFLRAAQRFGQVARSAALRCPLGSGALAGSTLPLDREAAARALGFAAPSRNALDAIGNRDAALDLAHAYVRAVVDASRACEELVLWATPAFGYVRLGDAASTGSSLMPQKRNPDPFELIRAKASSLVGAYAGALATLCGLGLSYHRDLQETKALAIATAEQGLAALAAFERALPACTFVRERLDSHAAAGYTIATDIADALVARGVTAREAHVLAGRAVADAERENRELNAEDLRGLAAAAGLDTPLGAPLTARESIAAKRTAGSTSAPDVREQLDSLLLDLRAVEDAA